MKSKDDLAEEWNDFTDEAKRTARQIVKSFAEKGLTICDAEEILNACEIYIEVNGKVALAD